MQVQNKPNNSSMKKLFLILAMNIAIIASGQLSQTNGPSGGNLNAMVVKGDTIYAAICNTEYLDYGAVYYSTDNGLNWKNISPHTPFYPVTSMIVNNGTLFIGTRNNSVSSSGGVYITSNNGLNWSVANTIPSNAWIGTMSVCNGIVFITSNNGIFKTSNNGLTWQSVDGIGWCCRLASNGTTIFAVGGAYGYGCGPTGEFWGAYYSTNYGVNWQCLGFCTGQQNAQAITFINNYIVLSVDTHIYRTSNYGSNWEIINDSVLTSGANNLITYNNKLYASTSYNVYVSTNSGVNWNNIFTSPIGNLIKVISAKDNYLYAGTSRNGLYRSSNSGTNWELINKGIANVMVNTICKINNNIFAGTTYNGGIFSTTDNGNNWSIINNGIEGSGLFNVLTKKDNYLYGGGVYQIGGNVYSDVMITSNNGANWFLGSQIHREIFSIVTSGNNLYAGVQAYSGQYIFKSTNNGINWSPSSNGIYGSNVVISMFSLNDTSLLAASGYLWKTTNSGVNWYLCDSGNVDNKVSYFCTNDTIIYAGSTNGIIYTSTNSGNNWNIKISEIQGRNIKSMTALNNYVFAGMGYPGGLYMSTNYGNNWTYLGLDSVFVTGLLIHDGYLFAATYGYGVWKYPLSPIVKINIIEQNVPKYFGLNQNYPNPFNPSTNVKFSIVNAGDVKLVVYDVRGREVQTLVNESLKPGTYEVSFDGSSLTSGVYFYRLITNGYTQARKMLMIK